MRTTIDIDDDVLAAAKDIARAEGKTMSQVISELARKALTQPMDGGFAEAQAAFGATDWPTLPNRHGVVVTQKIVDRILDELDVEDATPWDHERDQPRVFDDESKAKPRQS
jgi:Arc/MetJ family transcription regulator